MKPNVRNLGGCAKADNLFFLAILSVLIGCTLVSGGTAVILATEMLNEAAINIAQAAD